MIFKCKECGFIDNHASFAAANSVRGWSYVLGLLTCFVCKYGWLIEQPHWEAVPDDDGVMWRVRWSQPDADGKYLWTGHYPTENIGQHMAERQAEEWNKMGKRPEEWLSYLPRKAGAA